MSFTREIAAARAGENGAMQRGRRRRRDVRECLRSTPYHAFPAQKLRTFVH
jgi:hypothetical protein